VQTLTPSRSRAGPLRPQTKLAGTAYRCTVPTGCISSSLGLQLTPRPSLRPVCPASLLIRTSPEVTVAAAGHLSSVRRSGEMASPAPSAGANPSAESASPASTVTVHDAIQCLLARLTKGEVVCVDALAALCRDRAAEIAAIPVPLAAALVRSAVEAVARALSSRDAPKTADVLATLRHLLACPSLRDVAIKASRLKSLAIAAIRAASQRGCKLTHTDAAAAAVLRALQGAGVDITSTGSLVKETTPLIAAMERLFLGAAQVLMDAGADVNGLADGGFRWPLCAAATSSCEAGMVWLLKHGASLTTANAHGRTIAHVLAVVGDTGLDSTLATSERFCCHWLRRVSAAEPRLLEALDGEGCTPLMLAASTGAEACVAALVELGADPTVSVAGRTAVSFACNANSLPVVRQLVAAGAANAAALPPGSPQARHVALAAAESALASARGCGECAARCGGHKQGNCADGLVILRAVLAAGVREAVGPDGHSLGSTVGRWLCAANASKRISAENALTVLQTLRAAGVDVLARGPADELSILHAAAAVNAPALVRWLVAEAGAPLEERDSWGSTPLLTACGHEAWAAAHALLDGGARAGVQRTDAEGMWPVVVLAAADCDAGWALLLQRILAADRDSLLRCSATACSALHMAAINNNNNKALAALLNSGLPHLAEAINAVAVFSSTDASSPSATATPLHGACGHALWDAALALLAAGARVDITGHIGGRLQTMAEWARRSPACKHRGVKSAIAARAREHAAQAAAVAKGLPSGGAGFVAGETAAAPAAAATGGGASADAAAGTAVDVAASFKPAAGATTQPRGRKGRRGAASNRAEEPQSADDALELIAPPAAGGTVSAGLLPLAVDGSVAIAASAAAAAAAAAVSPAVASATLSTCEDPAAAAAAAIGPGPTPANAPESPALAAPSLNLPEDPLSQPAAATSASSDAPGPPAQHGVAVSRAEGSGSDSALPEPAGHASAAGPCAGDIDPNTREPGADPAFGANTCEPGADPAFGANTCEPGAEPAFRANTNTCELGEGSATATTPAGRRV